MPQLFGWLFDVYPSPQGMTVWIIDEDSRTHRLTDSLSASFFVAGPRAELHALCEFIRVARLPVRMRRAERYDIFLRREIELLEIVVNDPARFPLIVQTVTRHKPSLTYYNCDIAPAQIYFYERHLFPLARVQVEVDASNHIRAIEACDSPWDLDYELPPLKVMTLRLEGDSAFQRNAGEFFQNSINPNHCARGALEIGVEDSIRVLHDDNPRELLIRVKELLQQYDPDVIVSAWGDSFILPRLLEMSRRYGVPLPLNRDPQHPIQFRPPRSYFSYGRIVYKTASHTLFGRWHIDRENAFLIDDYGLEGTFELARITQMPVQQVARTSTGSGISAMQVATAYRQNILVPWQKREPEAWKTADELIVSDKGGLIFQPIVGLHEQVAELDFTSMFPTIMERFNISPETVNCPCCKNSRVPELGYSICRQRRGLIPETLAPLIAKRSRYKKIIKQQSEIRNPKSEIYKRRVSAHKWLLVTCFGYLGYKNARFGKIEAHEAVNAYGRNALLTAKEIVEKRGFTMLHAIVDSLWIQKPNARDDEYDEIVRAISETTQLPIELEGVYNWIAFLPSRTDPRLPVANRYFGAFRDGDVKIRGIEIRRHDTPPFIKRAQTEMIQMLATATNRAEFRERAREVLQLTLNYLDRLYAGQIPFDQLVITQNLSRDPMEYTKNNLNAIVAKELLGRGINLSPGESIRYIITDQKARVPSDRARAVEHIDGSYSYDAEKYAELFLRSVTTLFSSIGMTQDRLQKYIGESRAPSRTRRELRQPERPQLPPSYTLPLFEFSKNQKRAHSSVSHQP